MQRFFGLLFGVPLVLLSAAFTFSLCSWIDSMVPLYVAVTMGLVLEGVKIKLFLESQKSRLICVLAVILTVVSGSASVIYLVIHQHHSHAAETERYSAALADYETRLAGQQKSAAEKHAAEMMLQAHNEEAQAMRIEAQRASNEGQARLARQLLARADVAVGRAQTQQTTLQQLALAPHPGARPMPPQQIPAWVIYCVSVLLTAAMEGCAYVNMRRAAQPTPILPPPPPPPRLDEHTPYGRLRASVMEGKTKPSIRSVCAFCRCGNAQASRYIEMLAKDGLAEKKKRNMTKKIRKLEIVTDNVDAIIPIA